MRVPRLTAWLWLAMAGFALFAGCGGDGDGARDESLRGRTITVWNNEHQPDRMAATREILADFTRRTGIRTELVAVPEDGLPGMVSDAGPGELADVILSASLSHSHAFAARGRFDTAAAEAVVERLGVDTFSQRALALVNQNGNAVAVPSDGWGQLLIYRRDLFERAGLDAPETLADVAMAAKKLDRPRMAGIAIATAPGDGFTAETFEHVSRPGVRMRARQPRRQSGDRIPRVRGGARVVRRRRAQLLVARRAGRRFHAQCVLRRAGGHGVLVPLPARRPGRIARRHAPELPPVCA